MIVLRSLTHGKNGSTVDGWTKCKSEAFEETERTEKRTWIPWIDRLQQL